MTVGEQIRTARQRAGLSQRELARRSGVAQPNIAAIETGRVQPTQVTVDRLRRASTLRPSEAVLRHRDEILQRIEAVGGTEPRLFGSIARGTDGLESDVDLLVDLGPTPTLMTLGLLVHDLEVMLGVSVDLVHDAGDSPALQRARTEAVPL